MITMQPLTSSNILAAGHDGAEQGEMRITYHSGKTYSYSDVAAEDFKGLMSAESPGRHLRQMGLLNRGVLVVEKKGKKEEGHDQD